MDRIVNLRLSLGLAVAFLVPLPVERVNLGGMTIILGETTFAQISRTLGVAPIARSGDAGDSRYQLCYRSAGAEPITYYLETGEEGGGERVDQLEAIAFHAPRAAEDSAIARDCHTLSRRGVARTNRGIELGLTRRQVESRLGGRGRDSSGVVIYEGSDVRRYKDVRATAWSFLRIRYDAGRVVAFAAGANITD